MNTFSFALSKTVGHFTLYYEISHIHISLEIQYAI